VPVSINTLTDVIFKDQINDLSFTVDNRLVVLLEHQSTINPNMPLRLLLYIARVYEKIIDMKKVYAGRLVPIPWPEFIVLYNGTGKYPDRGTLKLSDSFKEAGDLLGAAGRLPDLELTVRVYNINPGHNGEILKRCRELGGYSVFIDKVRAYAKTISDEKLAFKEAINDCIEHGILREFLELHSSEVFNMLLTEWNTETWGEVQREEGREEGREEAKKEDAKNFLALGVSPATVAKATGLDMETIRGLSVQ
ncbi:MAG: Rpn family recombination-promoting nuclease/putative transposase, partial [Treponema sp.]|jgi:hypothetical protein|nr:Rpn family recombination-promoting nuclease/putative transposase [Treponema sp.]